MPKRNQVVLYTEFVKYSWKKPYKNPQKTKPHVSECYLPPCLLCEVVKSHLLFCLSMSKKTNRSSATSKCLESAVWQETNCPYLSCDLIQRSTIICNFLALDYIKAFLCSFRLSQLFLFSPELFFPKHSRSLLKLKQWFLYISWVLCIFEKHLRTHFDHIFLCWKLHKTSWLLPGKQCLLFFYRIPHVICSGVE